MQNNSVWEYKNSHGPYRITNTEITVTLPRQMSSRDGYEKREKEKQKAKTCPVYMVQDRQGTAYLTTIRITTPN